MQILILFKKELINSDSVSGVSPVGITYNSLNLKKDSYQVMHV